MRASEVVTYMNERSSMGGAAYGRDQSPLRESSISVVRPLEESTSTPLNMSNLRAKHTADQLLSKEIDERCQLQ